MYVEYLPGEKHGSSKPERSDDPDAFDDAGYELTDKNIVIDIDHLPKESIRKMIEIFNIKTMVVWTDRGAHLWFEKPAWFKRRMNGICKLSFEIEQHVQSDRKQGMTIKRNGVMRQVDNMGVFQVMPDIFIVKTGNSRYEDLTGLSDGESRNNKLFSYRRKLSDCDGWQKMVRFVNQYVFAEPLDDQELSGIMRELSQSELEGKADERYEIAERMMSERGIVKYSGSLWFRDDCGHYAADDDNDRLKKLIYAKVPGQDTRFVDEVIKQIYYRADKIDSDTAFPIILRNGIVNNGKFTKMEGYSGFSPYYIPVKYDPDAPPVAAVDAYLDQLTGGDPDYRAELEEVIGFVMVTDPEKVRACGKFFMFRGDGRNGKGTFLQILKKIFGSRNCTTLSIKQMTDDRYKVTMIGKLVNLGDDIEPEAINNDQMKILKNITTCDTISVRRLYSQSETATYTVKLIFTTNDNNKSFEKGYAYERRVKWMPMFNKIEKVDPNFIEKLTTKEALAYWMKLIVNAYIRLMTDGWTTSGAVEDFNKQYHEENNPAVTFVKSFDEDDFRGKIIGEIKKMYTQWYGDDEVKIPTKEIIKALKDVYGLKEKHVRDGQTTRRVYMPDTQNG